MTLSVFKGTDLGALDWAEPGIDSVDFRGSDFSTLLKRHSLAFARTVRGQTWMWRLADLRPK